MTTRITHHASPVTRAECAEAYADLYEVPMTEMYRRYGAVLLPAAVAGGRVSLPSASPKEARSGR